MKHIFVVNPMAGKGSVMDKIPQIEQACKANDLDYEIYFTQKVYDGIDYCKKRCQELNGEQARFYACGGDGTVFEVVNGIMGYEGAQFAVIPLGSGNDFIKLFGSQEDFLNVNAQLAGRAIDIDVIKCGERYAVNQCSMGLDGEICAKQASFKKIPGITGEASYIASLIYCFFRKIKSVFTIQIDDNKPFTQTVLFAVAGNSRWYGGGFKAAPFALPDDGLLDFVVVEKNMNRLKLLPLINVYKNGNHINNPKIPATLTRGKKMTVHSDNLAAVNMDGECEYVNDATFEIIENGIKFVLPTTSGYMSHKESGKISATIT
ncbi:MAG: YegS/Rv2252/BmrU family lipid kinase [Oscillospiraceae bacterium]|jgi:YegS/Rv2252/BmrU family lipid kinase|nr:YegS/Rv2252/BmrU family lipid kinase [Oscillospiraceae bacterium]